MPSSALTGLIVAAVVLLVAALAGLAKRRRDGRFRSVAAPAPDGAPAATRPAAPLPDAARGEVTRLDPVLAGLGVAPGTPVTLVQFSSAFCAPCRATRTLCADVAATVPGVRHIEIGAESHLDAVRALGIMRTPTLLVVDATGRIVSRASGAPNRAQLLAAVASALPAGMPPAARTPATGSPATVLPVTAA